MTFISDLLMKTGTPVTYAFGNVHSNFDFSTPVSFFCSDFLWNGRMSKTR